jgi:hypothetical protein
MLEPLIEPNLQHFPSSRKRAMAGLKVVEEEQANRRRQRRLAAVAAEEDRAQDEHEEREEERTAMIADRWHQSQSQFSSLDLGSSTNPSSKTKAPPPPKPTTLRHWITTSSTKTGNLVALTACDVHSRRSFADVAGRKADKGEREEGEEGPGEEERGGELRS